MVDADQLTHAKELRGSSGRRHELSSASVAARIDNVLLLEWTAALLHAATDMRPEEALGLKWSDIDWQKGQINIRRGWSKGKETAGKTESSMTGVAMHQALSDALQAWRREPRYAQDTD